MATFVDQDDDFLRWQKEYPEGFVLNIYHPGPPGSGVIHPSGCTHFEASVRERRYLTHGRAKACGESLAEVMDFASRHQIRADTCVHC